MWRDLLSLSRQEQLAFIGLIIALLVVFGFFFYSNSPEERQVDAELLAWAKGVNVNLELDKRMKTDTVFSFNPNTETVKRLELLGFSKTAIINLYKYREAGGSFTTSKKLQQIYGLDSALYVKLEPYVDLDSHSANKNNSQKMSYTYAEVNSSNSVESDGLRSYRRVTKKDDFIVELNTADTAELVLLKGIGPVLSKRIIAYRNKLGGFYSVEQLSEVYGLSQSVIDFNSANVKVDQALVVPIDISEASLRQMKEHPYLNFYMAKEIYEARKRGELNSIRQFIHEEPFQNCDTIKLYQYFVVEKERAATN